MVRFGRERLVELVGHECEEKFMLLGWSSGSL
jgi:hypothetical protein